MTQLSAQAQANLAAFATEQLKRGPRTITTHKPLYPPVRVLTGQCEGIEPPRMSEYIRHMHPGPYGAK